MKKQMNVDKIKFKQASETELLQEKYVATSIKHTDSVKKKNFEALYIHNKYSFQSEYTSAHVDARKGQYDFYAYYLQGSYFILGDGRKYKTGTATLSKVKPNRDGDIELAFRYSYIDLIDKDELGGTQSDCNYGLNWYINNELKLMLNYIVAEPKNTATYNGRLQILQARALFAF